MSVRIARATHHEGKSTSLVEWKWNSLFKLGSPSRGAGARHAAVLQAFGVFTLFLSQRKGRRKTSRIYITVRNQNRRQDMEEKQEKKSDREAVRESDEDVIRHVFHTVDFD